MHMPALQVHLFKIALLLSAIPFCSNCTDQAITLVELKVTPEKINLSKKTHYSKPFTVYGIYSNKEKKNLSNDVIWLSENSALLAINNKGEIKKTSPCLQASCLVSLIATHPASGKSARVSVFLKPSPIPPVKKKIINDNDQQRKETSNTSIDDEDLSANEALLPEKSLTDADVLLTNQIKTDESQITNKDNSESQGEIKFLKFSSSKIDFYSGQHFLLEVIGVLTNGDVIKIPNESITCHVDSDTSMVVKIFENCTGISLERGVINIGAKLTRYPNIQSLEPMEITVHPIPIDMLSGNNIQLLQINNKTEFVNLLLSGLTKGSIYKISYTGTLYPGVLLLVSDDAAEKFQYCFNRAPASRLSVTCYFLSQSDKANVIIENPFLRSISGNVELSIVDETFFPQKEYQDPQHPALISVGSAISTSIFANEAGINNRHYYQFETIPLSNYQYVIRLKNYQAEIKLDVSWPGGNCAHPAAQNKKETICAIPKNVSGKVNVVVDGNNGRYGFDSSEIAALGATGYTLSLDKEE